MRGGSGGGTFEQKPQGIRIDDFVSAQLHYAHAAIRNALGQTRGNQQVERLAYRRLADAQLRGNLLLSQPLAGGILPSDNALVENFEDVIL
jgi:hypothetical protein